MMIYIAIILMIGLAGWSYYKYKDIISPPLVLLFPWIVSLVLLNFTNFKYDGGSIAFLYFLAGSILFSIGYFIVSRNTKRLEIFSRIQTDDEERPAMEVRPGMIYAVVLVEIILTVASLVYLASLADIDSIATAYNQMSIARTQNGGLIADLILYFYTFEIAFTIFIVYVFFNIRPFPFIKIVFAASICLGLIGAMLSLGRTTLLLFFIATLIVYIVSRGVGNRKIIISALLAVFVFLMFFTLYNFYKYTGLNFGKEETRYIMNLTLMYSSGSPATFQNWFESGHELIYGRNIFRFVFAILNAMGFNVEPRSLLNDFMLLAPGIDVNTYTVYHYYAMDFGKIFALMLQIPLGMFHGYLYNKATKLKPFWIYVFALSMYPLLMQFFQDQYASLTSAWIQYVFYGFIFFKSGLFIKKEKVQSTVE